MYVADCAFNRVQLFRSGQRNATTVVGTAVNSTYGLICPTGITLDADGNLFISDRGFNRVLRRGPAGDRCIVGCNGSSGSASFQLNSHYAVAFDSQGNLFVADGTNKRIQKFQILDRGQFGE